MNFEGSCLSYGHSCWGAHGKRSGQLKKQHSGERFGLGERWAIVKLNGDVYPNKGTLQNISPNIRPDQMNDLNVSHQMQDGKFSTNSDEDDILPQYQQQLPVHGDSNRSESQRNQGLRQNKRSYGNEFDDDSIDDISNMVASATDDVPDNRNSRIFKILNPNLRKLVS